MDEAISSGAPRVWRGTVLPVVPLLIALGVGVPSVAVVAKLQGSGRSYSSTSTASALIDLAAGLGLLAAGSVYQLRRRRGSVGMLTVLLGVAWLAVDWSSFNGGPAVIRSVGMVVAPFLFATAIHLGVAL